MRRYQQLGRDPLVVRVHGATLEALFEEVAYAVFDQGYHLETIPATYSRPVIAGGDTVPELLGNWVDELLAMSRVEVIIPSYFTVDRLEEGGVQGSAAGLATSEATRRGAAAVGLIGPLLEPVAIAEGWWTDVTIDLEPRLRPI